MSSATNLKTYSAEELTYQDLNDQNDAFVARINERLESSDCVSTNTANKVVKRDASGNFSAGTITASLTGNVTGNVTGNLTGNVTGNVTGNLTGDVTGSITKTTNIAGGAAGSVPYQSATDTTAFLAAGTTGQVVKQGASVPEWFTLPITLKYDSDWFAVSASTNYTLTHNLGAMPTIIQVFSKASDGTIALCRYWDYADAGSAGVLVTGITTTQLILRTADNLIKGVDSASWGGGGVSDKTIAYIQIICFA